MITMLYKVCISWYKGGQNGYYCVCRIKMGVIREVKYPFWMDF